MSECAAVIDGSGSTECPMATRRRSLRWICSCRCVNCSYDECVGLDQTIAVQGFVTDQPLLSNNRSPYGVSPALLHKRGHLIIFYLGRRGGGGTGSLGFDGWLRGRGSAGPCLRAQGSSDEDETFALCARGKVDRFQCLLRPGPAAAWVPVVNWGQAASVACWVLLLLDFFGGFVVWSAGCWGERMRLRVAGWARRVGPHDCC